MSWSSRDWWKFPVDKIRQLQALSGWERWMLLNALLALPITAAALQLIGLNQWRSLMAKTAGAKSAKNPLDNTQQANEAGRVARVVSVASRHGVYRPNCLQQSLVLWWLLKRRNIASEIRFGARKEERELAAHAWVEFDRLVLNDARDVSHRFTPFSHTRMTTQASTAQQDL